MTRLKTFRLLGAALASLCAFALPPAQAADAFPSRPVRAAGRGRRAKPVRRPAGGRS